MVNYCLCENKWFKYMCKYSNIVSNLRPVSIFSSTIMQSRSSNFRCLNYFIIVSNRFFVLVFSSLLNRPKRGKMSFVETKLQMGIESVTWRKFISGINPIIMWLFCYFFCLYSLDPELLCNFAIELLWNLGFISKLACNLMSND